MTRLHQIKAGIEGKYHTLRYQDFQIHAGAESGYRPAISPPGSFDNNTYTNHPYQLAAYIQDKIELDYLVVDLPPGTGDAQLTLAQLIPMSGAIITVTPQPVATHDGERLRDLVDMRSGMEGSETSNDAYRDPKHKEFQLEATLGWLPRTAPELPDAARHGDLFGMLRTIKRERKAGEKWAYTSSKTVVIGEIVSRVAGRSLAETISDLIWSRIGAEHDAMLILNERGFPMSGAGMAATLRDVARFGLVFTKNPPTTQQRIISDPIVQRIIGGRAGEGGAKPDEHDILPLTYEWDMISNKGELVKGGWAGQLVYINRDKDVVVAWFGTNQNANPPLQPLPCRIIANTFF